MPLGAQTLLTQNSELRPDGIWNYAIPAWYVTRPDGSRFMTCPNAGACAQVCYARNGTYRFSNVLEAHTRNLNRYLADPGQWLSDLHGELAQAKFRPSGIPRPVPAGLDPDLQRWADRGGQAVRIHDSGDFFSEEYLRDWLYTASLFSDILFYAYTKEVSMVKGIPAGDIPPTSATCSPQVASRTISLTPTMTATPTSFPMMSHSDWLGTRVKRPPICLPSCCGRHALASRQTTSPTSERNKAVVVSRRWVVVDWHHDSSHS